MRNKKDVKKIEWAEANTKGNGIKKKGISCFLLRLYHKDYFRLFLLHQI